MEAAEGSNEGERERERGSHISAEQVSAAVLTRQRGQQVTESRW